MKRIFVFTFVLFFVIKTFAQQPELNRELQVGYSLALITSGDRALNGVDLKYRYNLNDRVFIISEIVFADKIATLNHNFDTDNLFLIHLQAGYTWFDDKFALKLGLNNVRHRTIYGCLYPVSAYYTCQNFTHFENFTGTSISLDYSFINTSKVRFGMELNMHLCLMDLKTFTFITPYTIAYTPNIYFGVKF